MTDAVVLAGGRISGPYARAAGTPIKALAPLAGEPLVSHVVRALAAAGCVRRICVVGPEQVRDVLDEGCLWESEGASALENVLAGFRRLGASEDPVLLCGSDAPLIPPAGLDDFVGRAGADGDIWLPVVRREHFVAAFPGNLGIYVRLADGAFTGGSQFLVRPRALVENLPLVESLFRRRKSQLAMAGVFGAGLIWDLVTGRLSIGAVEARLSRLAGCRCRAVLDCRPELAFDIDSVFDLRYAERWLGTRSSTQMDTD